MLSLFKKSYLSTSGFTLVELLVAVSILAVLGAISLVVFDTSQKITRDGKRLAEISFIAKSLETNKDWQSKVYRYNLQLFKESFPHGIPNDPLNVSKGRNYCLSINTTNATPPSPCQTNWNNGCPGNCSGSNYISVEESLDSFSSGSVLSWTICASMERAAQPFCEKSLTR